MVFKLHKALYGLKQVLRAWYNKINSYLIDCGFKRSPNEATLYTKGSDNEKKLIVSLYIDDLLITGDDGDQIKKLKTEMERLFETTNLGEMKNFLGMKIHQSSKGIFISQEMYAKNLLKNFKMEGCKAMSTPLMANEKLSKDDKGARVHSSTYRSLIGSLFYLTISRPDLMFSSSLHLRFMQNPREIHMGVVKRILRYIKGIIDHGIWFKARIPMKL